MQIVNNATNIAKILRKYKFRKKKNYFSCYKQYRFVYLQRQEDNLSTLLLNRHYKAMPEAKRWQTKYQTYEED